MATRPRLHFTAEEGFVSDPLGITYRDGTYHLFYQALPNTTRWSTDTSWGHATSPDLLEWTEQPIALAPGDGDDGCWSGSVVVPPAGDAVLFYTSVQRPDVAVGRIRRARPVDPDWREWAKEDIVADPPPGVALVAFRDPFVFRDGDGWRMLVGGGMSGGTATTFVYSSGDLTGWAYTGRLAERRGSQRQPVWTGTLWECVQLVALGDNHVLVVSVQDQHDLQYVAAAVGTYAAGRFRVASWHRLTYGPAPYAASTYTDGEGRIGLMAWLRRVSDRQAGWTGALTVPMLLTVDPGGQPRLSPHPVVTFQREEPPDADGWPTGGAVDLEWTPRADRHDTLTVHADDGGTVAEVAARGGLLVLTVPGRTEAAMPWSGGDVRLLLDGPVLELFCDGALLAGPVSPAHQRLDAFPGRKAACRYWVVAERSP